jgi:hypothetical protein
MNNLRQVKGCYLTPNTSILRRMTPRTTGAAMAAEAEQDLIDALAGLGFDVERSAPSDESYDVVARADGHDVRIEVKAFSVLSPDRAARLDPHLEGATVGVVVADQISAEARKVLADRGWGYFDRRGRLAMRASGLMLDMPVEPVAHPSNEPASSPLAGRGGMSLACALLLRPDDPPSLREVARRAGFSAPTVSAAGKKLRDLALVRPDGTPLVPELFWAVVDEWKPHRVPVATLTPSDAATVAGPLGALAWGAEVVATADYPPDLYVSDRAILRRATAGPPPPSIEQRAATIAVAPTPLVCSEPSELTTAGLPVAQALFVALDLAIDKARGLELLDTFNPQGVPRVW